MTKADSSQGELRYLSRRPDHDETRNTQGVIVFTGEAATLGGEGLAAGLVAGDGFAAGLITGVGFDAGLGFNVGDGLTDGDGFGLGDVAAAGDGFLTGTVAEATSCHWPLRRANVSTDRKS